MSRPTDFQKQVWAIVRQIPPVKVITYGDIATALGSRQSVGLSATSRTNCRGGGCCMQKASSPTHPKELVPPSDRAGHE